MQIKSGKHAGARDVVPYCTIKHKFKRLVPPDYFHYAHQLCFTMYAIVVMLHSIDDMVKH